ncbi:MAG TPA: HIT family protein [Ktedonobacteraceae bacterium]|nr:HIT family protein [Ktedonobacteraceae bacterium]
MQNGNIPTFDIEANTATCEFCQRSNLAAYILKETPAFLIATDHAPLVEGHLLIITKQHYTCYGVVPAELDAELFALKREVQQFLTQYYAPVVFWEHGIFRQTVYHAHLHCFPFGTVEYDISQGLHATVVHAQEDIRRWYASRGQYFFMENGQITLLFAPVMEHYWQVIKTIFAQAASRSGKTSPRSPQQRREEGVPLIEATIAKWRLFQQQGASYVDQSDTR